MRNTDTFDWNRFRQAPLIGILRGYSADVVYGIAAAYAQAKLYALEITMNTAGAPALIAGLRDRFPTLLIGAGTVRTLDELAQATEAGAQFIVTPVLGEEVIRSAVTQGLPVFPGAFTPSEIYRAWTLGATAIKVFPATQLGPSYIREVLAPLDGVKLLPTGGVTLDNLPDYLTAGAVGAGMGSGLFPGDLIAAGDYAGLVRHFERVCRSADTSEEPGH